MLTLLLGKAHLVEPDFGKPTPMTGTEYGGDGEEDATWVLPLRPVTNWIDALEALLGASTGRVPRPAESSRGPRSVHSFGHPHPLLP